MDKGKIKQYLLKRLLEENAFWSYDTSSIQNISDWNLIKHVLIQLDIEDTGLLFDIYPKNLVKKVWLKELVLQGDYLKNMNIFYAAVYFDIKHPVVYLKRMETYLINRY